MKRYNKIILLVIVVLITNLATFVFTAYLSVGSAFNTNLKYTEQIDFLLNSIVLRLENKDPNLLRDLRSFSEEYQISYEGQHFMEMSKKYFPKEFNNKIFAYQIHRRTK